MKPTLRLKGKWYYLYRAVDKAGNTVEFLFKKNRDKAAARAFFDKAFSSPGQPEKVTIDKSGSNLAALTDSLKSRLRYAKSSI